MVEVVAHRGFAAEFPENTVSAVEGAVQAGADMVEVDVRRAGSGEIVVHHDPTVDRVTESSGAVETFTVEELAALDVLGSGEGIPTLAAVVDALPPGVGLNVELKEEGLAADTLRVVEGHSGPLLVSSFSTSALESVHAVNPTIDVGLLIERRPGSAVRRAIALDCECLHPRAGLCFRSLLVRRAHDAGLTVNAWTLRSRRMARLLTRLGVDGLIADTPHIIG